MHLSNSVFLRHGKALWAANQEDWDLPLSKLDKAVTGLYLACTNFSKGQFPPKFDDQQQAYDNEIAFRDVLPGVSAEKVADICMRKPFWFGKGLKTYLKDFLFLCETLEAIGVTPEARLLELGCGSGWMAEWLAQMNYQVTATTLSPDDVADANKRIDSLQAKGIKAKLEYRTAPMESVGNHLPKGASYDCVFIYEALHHAYDWRATLHAAHLCLEPGGWLLLCNEPNEIHTIVSYRVAVLSNTHEIGFKKSELVAGLREAGFSSIRFHKGRVGLKVLPLWISARK